MEETLQTLIDYLQKLEGLPAGALTLAVCITIGYAFRCLKFFPNEAIPAIVILVGAVFYPFIADANNDWTLRVWIVRNAGIGLVYGLVAWLIHNQVLSRIEDKLPNLKSLLGGSQKQDSIKPPAPPADAPTAVIPKKP